MATTTVLTSKFYDGVSLSQYVETAITDEYINDYDVDSIIWDIDENINDAIADSGVSICRNGEVIADADTSSTTVDGALEAAHDWLDNNFWDIVQQNAL